LTAIGPSNPGGRNAGPGATPGTARAQQSATWNPAHCNGQKGVLSTYLRAHYRCEREGIHKPRPGAHAELVAALSGHSPRPIPIDADAIDLEDRADQLNKVLNALSAYLTAVLDDTAQNVPGGLDLRKVDALLFDLASDKPPWCTRSNPHTRSGAAAAPTNALRLLGIHQHEDDAHGSLPWLSQA